MTVSSSGTSHIRSIRHLRVPVFADEALYLVQRFTPAVDTAVGQCRGVAELRVVAHDICEDA